MGKTWLILIKKIRLRLQEAYDEPNYVVFDLYGIKSDLSITNKAPEIAIEVIDTHFPDFKTFNYCRRITRDSPDVILFFYACHEPKLNHLENIGEKNNGRLRIAHYIQDGSFYIGEEAIEEKDYSYIKSYTTETNFDNDEEYYRAVRELEIDKKTLGKELAKEHSINYNN